MALSQSDMRPEIDGADEFYQSKKRRQNATKIAYDQTKRPAPIVRSNGEESENRSHPISNFTKGLPHDKYGNVDPAAHERLVKALRAPGNPADLKGFSAPLGLKNEDHIHPNNYDSDAGGVTGDKPLTEYYFKVKNPNNGASKDASVRKWESPLGGLNSDVEGPSVGGVSMPPAPRMGSSELCAEMAELYAMALLRDVPFEELTNPAYVVQIGATGQSFTMAELLAQLNNLSWFKKGGTPVSSDRDANGSFKKVLNTSEERRRNARLDSAGNLTLQTLFRGSTAGAQNSEYLSQFMLQGADLSDDTGDDRSKGKILFGTQLIDQRSIPDNVEVDYMKTWAEWLDVQNGAKHIGVGRKGNALRFLTTPRDLASYVHFDQLYQAYFNAALLISGSAGDLEKGEPLFDMGLPNNGAFPTGPREGFATWGGPHLLALFAEVSSRALKIVRRQKFQIHRRARPEVIAARLALAYNGKADKLGSARTQIEKMITELQRDCPKLLQWVSTLNKTGNPATRGLVSKDAALVSSDNPIADGKNILLPMAFPEGSPMHPAYGAGHATVAGACVTVLKAMFSMINKSGSTRTLGQLGFGSIYVGDGPCLKSVGPSRGVTVEGELDKLAANISIGRNFAGVHFYTDYYESLRLGERIAVGILQEQLQTSPENVSMSFKDFDGKDLTITYDANCPHQPCSMVDVDDSRDQAEWWLKNVANYNPEPTAAVA